MTERDEFEATPKDYDIGRGGVKLPKLDVAEGNFYPHHTVDFLRRLWELNETDTSEIGQQASRRNAGYFVVPATADKPTVFAFRQANRGHTLYDRPATTYQFFATPEQSGGLVPIMAVTHRQKAPQGMVSDRESAAIEDHQGHVTELGLYGSVTGDGYQPDYFANNRQEGMFTYDSADSQISRALFEERTRQIRELLS